MTETRKRAWFFPTLNYGAEGSTEPSGANKVGNSGLNLAKRQEDGRDNLMQHSLTAGVSVASSRV